MTSSTTILFSSGLYFLFGIAVISFRWNFGLLKSRTLSVERKYHLKTSDRLTLIWHVMLIFLWPMFVSDIFRDELFIWQELRRAARSPRVSKCLCDAEIKLDRSMVRRAFVSGSFKSHCKNCDRDVLALIDFVDIKKRNDG